MKVKRVNTKSYHQKEVYIYIYIASLMLYLYDMTDVQ